MNRKAPSEKVWLLYVKDRKKIWVFAAACALIMGVVYQLYDVSWEPLIYGMAICLAVGGAVMAVDYRDYRERHRQLVRLRQEVGRGIFQYPVPRSLNEADYIYLLEKACKENENFQALEKQRQQEALDYFTLWMHQVKTPIAAMRLILQGQDTDSNRQMRAELFKTEQYVEMALTYLRLGSGSTDYVFRKIRLDDVVRQAVRNYASLFVLKKIKLDFKSLECEVVSDEKWLAFVIGQLLSNAIKYTNKGCISIYMRPGNVLAIQDTGIGIAPEDLPRIWDKGFTGYNGRDHMRATGIGLYLCRRILEKLSHGIAVESEVGKGTRMSISFEIPVDK